MYKKLLGKIIEKYGTREQFANELGISSNTLTHKLSGKTDWSISEALKSVTLLDIPIAEFDSYFFEPLVEKSHQ